MSITNIGRKSDLTQFRRKEAIAKASIPNSTYVDMVYEEALKVLHGEDSE